LITHGPEVIRNAAREAASAVAGRPVRDRDRLISSGIIDSLSILKLISELESKLGIVLPTESLQPDDFDGLDVIVETVERAGRPA
jgi:acyl carrier protein